jgi:hypothetical protein
MGNNIQAYMAAAVLLTFLVMLFLAVQLLAAGSQWPTSLVASLVLFFAAAGLGWLYRSAKEEKST